MHFHALWRNKEQLEKKNKKDKNVWQIFSKMVLVIDLSYDFNSKKWKWTNILRTDSVLCSKYHDFLAIFALANLKIIQMVWLENHDIYYIGAAE